MPDTHFQPKWRLCWPWVTLNKGLEPWQIHATVLLMLCSSVADLRVQQAGKWADTAERPGILSSSTVIYQSELTGRGLLPHPSFSGWIQRGKEWAVSGVKRVESIRVRALNTCPVTQYLPARELPLACVVILPWSTSWGQGSSALQAVQIAEKPVPSPKEHLFWEDK